MATQPSDAVLLERFVTCREEAAFAALVQRHGAVVLRVCRRILHNEQDAEDAFQATFLVLARKAAAVRWPASAAGWLCGVARRLALNARAGAVRKRLRETPLTDLIRAGSEQCGCPLPEEHHPRADPLAEIARRELRRVLDAELRGLPEKYRMPVVLCYLEGKTNEEAARQLGWPAGSMSRRLVRARALLRQRLARYGLALALCLLCAAVVVRCAWHPLPPGGRPPVTVREAMTPFKPPEEGGQGIGSALARIARDDRPGPGWDQVAVLARQTAQVAERVKDHGPDKDREQWRRYADEMRASALELAQAAEERNDATALAAARRLTATCVKCHEVFRQ